MLLTIAAFAAACTGPVAICPHAAPDAMALVDHGAVAEVITAPGADPAVTHAAADLRGDLAALAGTGHHLDRHRAVIVGVLGHDRLIDDLVRRKHLDTTAIRGRWEAYRQEVIDHPLPGIDHALVIIGADRRGAAFGVYDLSRRAGVSPWAWWADVPITPRPLLTVLPGVRSDAPKVRYRGIFLNDEDPALKGWATARFGGLNRRFYAHVFDLMLRLKANYLWPAMWGKSLWQDDPQTAALAERMGIVLGTSHHEPMMRAQVEWHRAGGGAWDYTTNGARLRAFWRNGIDRSLHDDKIVTVGMRGDGDKPMTQGTAIPLLEHIVADQRRIIADVTGKPAADTPQVWALYKEVQDYYDQGMKVPDDVTLEFADDNWGNIRRLPEPGATRGGGYGVYYHFDYVGGPRSYRWLNVTQIGRVWQQMRLAYARGVDRIWITNVGDLKPMELPISFFLDLAWNPQQWGPDAGTTYLQAWAAEQFGADHAAEIGDILDRENRYAARRTPELRDAATWNLDAEWPRVIAADDRLVADARRVGAALPAADRDAYFELVLHPVLATTNLDHLYEAVARNHRAAAERRADTNALADQAARRFAEDRALATLYERTAGGKWPHMMDQTHIGYTSWDAPKADIMPPVTRIDVPAAGDLGVTLDGAAIPQEGAKPLTIDRSGDADRRLHVIDRGAAPIAVAVRSAAPWLHASPAATTVSGDTPIALEVDWQAAPHGQAATTITVAGGGKQFSIPITVANPGLGPGAGYVEADGVVAIDAVHGDRHDAPGAHWAQIAGLGRVGDAMTLMPQTARIDGASAPALSFTVTTTTGGPRWITLVAAPSLATERNGRVRCRVTIDGGTATVVDLTAADDRQWTQAVIAHASVAGFERPLAPGRHVVTVQPIDPGVVLERIEISRQQIDPLALDPPESERL